MTIRERFEALQRLTEGSARMGGGIERDECGEYLWRDDVLSLADALDAETREMPEDESDEYTIHCADGTKIDGSCPKVIKP